MKVSKKNELTAQQKTSAVMHKLRKIATVFTSLAFTVSLSAMIPAALTQL